MRIISKEQQAYGAFNNGEIVENKPIGFPQDGGGVKPFSNLFYWANAIALKDSTIGLHPHQGFEIISFILEGTIRHYDTQMDAWKDLHKGDVQIIRAGSGISHAEHMMEGSRMFQIWVDPDLSKTMSKEASYSDYKSNEFEIKKEDGYTVKRLIGADSHFVLDAANLSIQEVEISSSYKVTIDAEEIIAYYLLDGRLTLDDNQINVDDLVLIEDAGQYNFSGAGKLFEVRCHVSPGYLTYAQRMASSSHMN